MRSRTGTSVLSLAGGAALVAAACIAGVPTASPPGAALPAVHPAVSDYLQINSSTTPPTEAQCNSVGRRCFTPQSTRAAYNVGPLYAAGHDGTGITIAIVDSYGSDTMAHDLHVYNQAFNLPSMCGEEAVTCTPGMPTFSVLHLQGSPATKAPPAKSKGTGQKDKAAWALEVALDVETAHSIAPGANILLVATPTAETLGVNGLPQMMAAEQYVVDHHLAQVISQSFATTEEAFGSAQSLLNLRHAFISAAQNGVTVLGSSGDGGTANPGKAPVGGPHAGAPFPFPTVEWPASDPLVTGVGGTYLCTDPTATAARVVDSAEPPTACQTHPGQAEVGWIASGGGFSHVFARPDYQSALPAGSTAIGSMRGVPDIALQASATTGALVYLSLPPDGLSGLICGNAPCSTGWYDIGGTSLSCPQWAGLVAIAAQINGGGLGPINPALYKLGASSATYGNDFYDVTTGNNGADPSVPGFPATTGWDPVTGLGTPNAAALLPDLVAAVRAG
ncbi:S53 family peptidase [Arthrobacter sp.]|uniref:S53 family peptidase n=1 Tax=Arthrobacter sp. TaxID=1667 RepID=UPI00258E6237|nr:S53 family peptidase [Arthrobacter sp.]